MSFNASLIFQWPTQSCVHLSVSLKSGRQVRGVGSHHGIERNYVRIKLRLSFVVTRQCHLRLCVQGDLRNLGIEVQVKPMLPHSSVGSQLRDRFTLRL